MADDPKRGDRAASEEGTTILHTALSPAALHGLIEEFVTRSGTDYGEREAPIEHKIADVERQLERGEAQIVFDATTGTANIVSTRGT